MTLLTHEPPHFAFPKLGMVETALVGNGIRPMFLHRPKIRSISRLLGIRNPNSCVVLPHLIKPNFHTHPVFCLLRQGKGKPRSRKHYYNTVPYGKLVIQLECPVQSGVHGSLPNPSFKRVKLLSIYIGRIQETPSLPNLRMKLFIALLLTFLSVSAMSMPRSEAYSSPHDPLKNAVYAMNVMGRRGGAGGDVSKEMEMLRSGGGARLSPPIASTSKSPFLPSSPPILISVPRYI